MTMKILRLSLKTEWFRMIQSGYKKEEYREIKPFWTKRLAKGYTHVLFTLGYPKASERDKMMLFEYGGYSIGKGRPEWGGGYEDVYVLKIGKRVE